YFIARWNTAGLLTPPSCLPPVRIRQPPKQSRATIFGPGGEVMQPESVSRRGFLSKSIGGAAAFQIIRPELVRGAADEKLKAGLVGCGGRGTQAVENILTCAPNVEITALADVFE